eukprot:2689643-Rhodomonas_salina.1
MISRGPVTRRDSEASVNAMLTARVWLRIAHRTCSTVPEVSTKLQYQTLRFQYKTAVPGPSFLSTKLSYWVLRLSVQN